MVDHYNLGHNITAQFMTNQISKLHILITVIEGRKDNTTKDSKELYKSEQTNTGQHSLTKHRSRHYSTCSMMVHFGALYRMHNNTFIDTAQH